MAGACGRHTHVRYHFGLAGNIFFGGDVVGGSRWLWSRPVTPWADSDDNSQFTERRTPLFTLVGT